MDVVADLPVTVALSGPLGREVTAYAEAELGWHVVDPGGPLLPSFTLAAEVVPGVPTVVVAPAPAPAGAVRDALLAGAVDVIAWPHERDRLGRLRPARPSGDGVSVPVLRVAGCRGGVGTSTVALAIGGTVAWSGRRAVVVGDDDLLRLAGGGPWQGPGSLELATLGASAGAEVETIATPVSSVPGLSLLGGGAVVAATQGWPCDLVVVDGGRDAERADLIVAAADASLAAAPPHLPVLVVEHGPLDRPGTRRLLRREPAGWLPYSTRVAAAGCKGRVPASLPGSWVAALRGILDGLPTPPRKT